MATGSRSKLQRITPMGFLIYAAITVFTFICIVPFWYVIVSSVSRTPGFVVQGFTLEGYRYIFSTRTLPRSLLLTIYITLVGTAAKLLATSLMAYSLAERSLPGRGIVLNAVIFTMLFSGGMIPTYFVVKGTGLMNSLWSLIIPSLISPFNLIVLKNFYEGIPTELRESARIDGCHELILLWKIIMPLSLPALATFGLFYAVDIWNTYMSALLYIQKPEMWPIQVLLRRIVFVSAGLGDADSVESDVVMLSNSIKMAVIIVSTVPILCVYPFLQKHFAKGIMVGSVKG